jgi:protein ImuB
VRICAVSLPELRIELTREEQGAEDPVRPLALVVAPPPMTEAKLLGNTRITVASREARALGVQPGQTLAQARARASDLTVRVVRPEAVRDVLARFAEVGLAFGATVSFAMEGHVTHESRAPSSFGDIVWIDVTGCAHLHVPTHSASTTFDGETILASRLAGVIASLGHTCSVAIADGPRVAAMLARAAAQTIPRARSRRLDEGGPVVVRPGENAAAIAPLPVGALPLPAEDVRWLAKVGVRTIGEMRALPRAGLGARLGARARDVLSLLDGDDRAPLAPYVPPEVPEEEAQLEYGIEGTQALTFVAKTLTDRLSARLQGRAVAAARVELELHLDAAMVDESGAGSANDVGRERLRIETVTLDLPAPLSGAGDLLAALRPKIERLVLCAPILGARLRAPVLVHRRAAALSLFEPQPKAERALPRLVAELVSDLGAPAVSTLVLGDSWVPEERSRLAPFCAEKSDLTPRRRRRLVSSVPEPTRLLAEPRPVPRGPARDGIKVTRHLARAAAVEWWKADPATPSSSAGGAIDYVQAWTDDGAAWAEIDRVSGGLHLRGWFD